MAKKKAAKKVAKKVTPKRKTPERAALPGMEDIPIVEIEACGDALESAREEARRLRDEAANVEGAAEEALKQAMRKHGKEHYKRKCEDGSTISCNITKSRERVNYKHTGRRKPRA